MVCQLAGMLGIVLSATPPRQPADRPPRRPRGTPASAQLAVCSAHLLLRALADSRSRILDCATCTRHREREAGSRILDLHLE